MYASRSRLELLLTCVLCVCVSSLARARPPDVRPDDRIAGPAGHAATGPKEYLYGSSFGGMSDDIRLHTDAVGYHLAAPDAQQSSKRHLLQAALNITLVATPQQLVNALSQGAKHIQITAHLDMTGSSVQSNPVDDSLGAFRYVVYINSTLTDTVTGACTGAVPAPLAAKVAGAPLQPLAAEQCLLLTDVGGILTFGSGNTWIDNLYVRAVYTSRTPFEQSLMSAGVFSSTSASAEDNMPNLYVTGVQLQGDNVFERSGQVQSMMALGVSAPIYMSGCAILHTGGYQEAIWVHSASVNIINSTITDNAMSRGVQYAAVTVTEGGIWLQGTRLARNSAPVLLRTAEDETGTIASDAPLEYLTTIAVGSDSRSAPRYILAAQSLPPWLPYLDGSEPWFLSTMDALEFASRPANSTAYPPASSSALTRVSTAAKLQEAMQQGARHIVVEAHLDLSSLELVDFFQGTPNYLIGVVRDTTKSIRGNCTGVDDDALKIAGVPLVPRKPGQCILLADADLLTLGPGRLWVHNLYIRHKAPQRDYGVALMYTAEGMAGQLWMTGSTLQGTGAYDSTFGAAGLWMHSQAYVEGCTFLDLGGIFPAISAESTEVRIVNSSVSDTFVPDVHGGVIVADTGATVWLQGTSASGNKAVLPLIAKTSSSSGDGVFYSNRKDTWYFWNADGALERRATGQVPADTSKFLSGDDEWFASVRKELASATGDAQVTSLSTAAAVPSVAPVRVTTAKDLISAVSKGVRHIRVMDHIDLTGEGLPWPDVDAHLGHPSSTTHTITGNCTREVPAAMLNTAGAAARRAGQCAIIVDTDLLSLIHGRLWVDGLFVSLRRTSRTFSVVLIGCGDEGRYVYQTPIESLWLTRMVLQGDTVADPDAQRSTGVAVYSTLAANDVQVRQCGGEYIPVYVFGTASFEACSFVDNILADDNTGGISYTTEAGSITWLKNVTFGDNIGAHIVTDGEGRVFSSEPGLEYLVATTTSTPGPQPVPMQTARTAQFLSFSDPWLLEAAKEAGYTINTIQETAAPAGTAAASAGSPNAAPAPPGETGSDASAPAPPSSASSPLINTNTISIVTNGASVVLPVTGDPGTPPNTPPDVNATPDDGTSNDPDAGTPDPGPKGDGKDGVSGEVAGRTTPGSPGRKRDPNVVIISVAVLSAAVILIATAVFAFFLLRRRRRRNGEPTLAPPPRASVTQAGGVAGTGGAGQPADGHKPGDPSDAASHGHTAPSLQHATTTSDRLTTTVYSRATQSTTTASTAMTVAPATDFPANGAASGVSEVPMKDQLQAELTAMYEKKERFLDKYRVLKPEERRVGGQGLVQFMRGNPDADPVAVKFFLAWGAFEAELQLYNEGDLRSVMPEKLNQVPAGTAQSVRGYVFPPCIVLKKGQSLQDWRQIVQPETETVFDALSHIAKKLEQLHARGWVHRDLKPGNILRLPHLHSWTLMDFGSACRTGHRLQGSHALTTLIYCPPEAVRAKQEGKTLEVSAAADMWALGLISFELLTQKKPFFLLSQAEVEQRLCGQTPLLWEAEGPGVRQVLKQLGVLRETVLACLSRDPVQRPSAAEVCRTWKRIIKNNTTAA